MSTINDAPPTLTTPGFGEAFNYAVWTANTQIELCNVPWTSDYRDIVDFDTQAALDAYLDSGAGPTYKIGKLTYARAGDPIRINIPFNAVYKYNYLRVKNGVQPISATYTDYLGAQHTANDTSKTYYYFIQDVRYINPNNTELIVMLDVWQTFGRDITFGNCYVERGHIGIANENMFDNMGLDYLTVPEGMDIGGEYNITYQWENQIGIGDDGVSVIVGIGAAVDVDPGDTTNPNLATTNASSTPEGMPQGFDVLYFSSLDDYKTFINNFAETPWITQSIMFVTMVPGMVLDSTTMLYPANIWNTATNALFSPAIAHRFANQGSASYTDGTASGFRGIANGLLPVRYQNLKKFLVYPYMFIEMTAYNGQPLVLKPELIPDNEFHSIEYEVYQHATPPSPRWVIVPKGYNDFSGGSSSHGGEFLDMALIISDFPQFTVLNNNYLEYLASNKNAIAYGWSSAEWSQQKALLGAANAQSNARAGMDLTRQTADIGVWANNMHMRNANLNQVSHVASNALMAGVAQGNGPGGQGAPGQSGPFSAPAAAIASAVTGTIALGQDMAMRSGENSVNNHAIRAGENAQLAYAGTVAFNNYNLALSAAQGDYQNAVNGVQAKVQDARMIQPSSAGQIGGESFNASIFGPRFSVLGGSIETSTNPAWKMFLKLKQLNPGVVATIGEFWLRYGYAINRFHNMSAGIRCMDKMTYWKLRETYVTASSCPEVFKQSIRGIFEKGVSVWTDPDDIGTIDLATNTPLTGITL